MSTILLEGYFMHLIINIPCYNEEQTLPLVLNELPKKIQGIKKITIQIVDDGSTDKTVEIARKYKCDIVSHKENMGLGIAFKHGVEAALQKKADIMVNTDADNQYPSEYIAALVKPVVSGNADVVISNRQTWTVSHFSIIKKFFQWFGSTLVRKITDTEVKDAVSGFRAYNRESLLRLNVQTQFSYVLDTIMQCSMKHLRMESVDITINPPTRKSRLFKNMFQHMKKSGFNLIKIFFIYRPFVAFMWTSFILMVPAVLIMLRFLYYYIINSGAAGHIQSLIAASILFITSVLFFALGIIVTLIKYNRELVEEQLYLQKRLFYKF
ncbi:MAG: glycosyltransferase family 2 protein [Spirochaetes bacterium]|nr:glycosyltransferase family 2 protein [Spirochaetota bacterium]